MDLAHRRLTPGFTFYVSGGDMNYVGCGINVTTFGLCIFPLGIPQLQSDWSLSCNPGLDYAS